MPFNRHSSDTLYNLGTYEAPTTSAAIKTYFPRKAWKQIVQTLSEADLLLAGLEAYLAEAGASKNMMTKISKARCQLFGEICYYHCQIGVAASWTGKGNLYCPEQCVLKGKKKRKRRSRRVKRIPPS